MAEKGGGGRREGRKVMRFRAREERERGKGKEGGKERIEKGGRKMKVRGVTVFSPLLN